MVVEAVTGAAVCEWVAGTCVAAFHPCFDSSLPRTSLLQPSLAPSLSSSPSLAPRAAVVALRLPRTSAPLQPRTASSVRHTSHAAVVRTASADRTATMHARAAVALAARGTSPAEAGTEGADWVCDHNQLT